MFKWSPVIHITTCVISALAIVTNIAVCLIVLFKKSMRTYTNGFVVSLASSDVITGAVLFTYYMDVSILSEELVNIFYGIVLFCGVTNVCMSSLDRYFAIAKPLQYRQSMPRYFPLLITASWVGAVIYAFLPFAWGGMENLIAMDIYRCSVLVFALVLPYGVIIFVYRRIFQTVRASARLHAASHQQRIQTIRAATALRVVKCFVVVSLVFLCSWSPMIYITIAGVVTKLPPKFIVHASPISLVLGSLANPFIYSFIKPDFREALRKMLSCSKSREGDENHRVYRLRDHVLRDHGMGSDHGGRNNVTRHPISFETML